MKLLKQYSFILIVFLLMVVLVLFRLFSRTGFRYDAARLAESSVQGTNIVYQNQPAPPMDGAVVVLNLEGDTRSLGKLQDEAVTVSPESITDKNILNLIRTHKGPVLIYSDDSSVSARVWMVLAEMGMENVYILRVSGSTEQ